MGLYIKNTFNWDIQILYTFLVETPLETKLRPETKIYVTCLVKNINIDLPHFHENFLVFLCKNQKFKKS